MCYRGVVFDLDGTLVDSRPGIDAAAAEAQRQVLPGRAVVSMSAFIGPPIRVMFAEACEQDDQSVLDRLVVAFRAAYDGGVCCDVLPYPGMDQVLRYLLDRGVGLHVVTNKPAVPTAAILAHLGWLRWFDRVMSPDSLSPPGACKSQVLRALLGQLAIPASELLYIGDDDGDRHSCGEVDMPFACAGWGIGNAHSTVMESDVAMLRVPMDVISLFKPLYRRIRAQS